MRHQVILHGADTGLQKDVIPKNLFVWSGVIKAIMDWLLGEIDKMLRR